jgi:lysophospholipase L1-like esterase
MCEKPNFPTRCLRPWRRTADLSGRRRIAGVVTALAFAASGSSDASLLAHEGFDYPAGNPLAGMIGPVGFNGPYTAANAGLSISAAGFNYGDLEVSGQKLSFSGTTNNGNFGILTHSPEVPGSTVYLSYLMQVDATTGYAGVSLFEGNEEVLFTGKRSGSPDVLGMEPKVGTAMNSAVSSRRLSLIVCRIDFAASSATVRMYVNPTTGVEPANADVTVSRTTALTYDRLRVQSNGAVGAVDEIRLGETFEDVAPLTFGTPPRELVVLGSSVASGAGAAAQSEAWAYRLENLLENRPSQVPGGHFIWHVENASIGGDNTAKVLSRFPNDIGNSRAGANQVIVSLSLANEGLPGAANPQAVFDSFKNGLTEIVARCRALGISPILTLCYPENRYTAAEYAQVKRMNLLLNTWDLPSINFLGAIDDGSGHWAANQFADGGHPNSVGHGALFTAIVPSLFDAIAAGKTARPEWQGTTGYLRLQRDQAVAAPLKFTPTHPVHSFTFSLRVRTTELGTLAAVGTGGNRATLELRDGALVYIGPSGTELTMAAPVNDGRWHDLALAHRHGTQTTLVFIDGQLRGQVQDAHAPDLFVVGGAAGAEGRALAPWQADFQDVAIYRAAWTEDEALAQTAGALQQASMEIASPLADPAPTHGSSLENRAQSFSQLRLETAHFDARLATSVPTELEARSFVVGSVDLSWKGTLPGAAHFTIERRRSGIAEPWTVVGTVPGSTPFFRDTGLIVGTRYEYRVSAPEGPLQGDASDGVALLPDGQDAVSYDRWIGSYYPEPLPAEPVYLIDFNTNPNPEYGDVNWTTVTSTSSTAPYPVSDTLHNPSPIQVSISDSFDQFRSDNVAPLAGYAAAAQHSQFCLRDDRPLTGAITFTGLDPAVAYDFAFFARRGSLVEGYDYTGTYTFVGSGAPVVVTMDAKTSANLTHVPPVTPSPTGEVTLTISAGPGAGTDFPVINFIKLKRSTPGLYLVDFNTNPSPVYDGLKWNTVTSTSNTTPYPLVDSTHQPSPFTVAITDGFDQFRSDNVAPLADYTAAAQNSQFALRDDRPLTGAIQFAGLNPEANYDFAFFARRGSLVANYDYTGTYTFMGSGAPVVVVMDGATSTTLTPVPPLRPDSAGKVTLTVSAGPGPGDDFPVINFIQFKERLRSPDHLARIYAAADPDDDGISNFEEYARGLNPTVKDGAPLVVDAFAHDESEVVLDFTHDLRASDADFSLQSSADLTLWSPDATGIRSVIGRDGFWETFRYRRPNQPSESQRFFRLLLKDRRAVP